VLAPLATELPEKFNSVIWLRGGKPIKGERLLVGGALHAVFAVAAVFSIF
jgi:hypothetical protein